MSCREQGRQQERLQRERGRAIDTFIELLNRAVAADWEEPALSQRLAVIYLVAARRTLREVEPDVNADPMHGYFMATGRLLAFFLNTEVVHGPMQRGVHLLDFAISMFDEVRDRVRDLGPDAWSFEGGAILLRARLLAHAFAAMRRAIRAVPPGPGRPPWTSAQVLLLSATNLYCDDEMAREIFTIV